MLESHGYRNLLIQKGRGSAEVETTKTSTFAVECYRYKDSISNDIKQADLVISHAGISVEVCCTVHKNFLFIK